VPLALPFLLPDTPASGRCLLAPAGLVISNCAFLERDREHLAKWATRSGVLIFISLVLKLKYTPGTVQTLAA
jgi:hypothetical protein